MCGFFSSECFFVLVSGKKQRENEKDDSGSKDGEGEGEDGDFGFGLSDNEQQSSAPGDFLPLGDSEEE